MNEKSGDRQYCAQDIARRQTKTHNTKKEKNQDPPKKIYKKIKGIGGTQMLAKTSTVLLQILSAIEKTT
jgi:hypothetical protein